MSHDSIVWIILLSAACIGGITVVIRLIISYRRENKEYHAKHKG
jgi:hypothetical protein